MDYIRRILVVTIFSAILMAIFLFISFSAAYV